MKNDELNDLQDEELLREKIIREVRANSPRWNLAIKLFTISVPLLAAAITWYVLYRSKFFDVQEAQLKIERHELGTTIHRMRQDSARLTQDSIRMAQDSIRLTHQNMSLEGENSALKLELSSKKDSVVKLNDIVSSLHGNINDLTQAYDRGIYDMKRATGGALSDMAEYQRIIHETNDYLTRQINSIEKIGAKCGLTFNMDSIRRNRPDSTFVPNHQY